MAEKGDGAGFIACKVVLMPGRAYVDYDNLAAGQFAVTETWIEQLILSSCFSRDSKLAARVQCP